MDRRTFLTGLTSFITATGAAVVLANAVTPSAQAAPIARAMRLPESVTEAAATEGGRTPDGTEVELARHRRRWWRRWRRRRYYYYRPRRYYYRRYYRPRRFYYRRRRRYWW
jgi:hypothetical protein